MNTDNTSYPYYIQQFKWAQKRAKEFILPLDEELFIRRPLAQSWCAGECFSHLTQTGTRYLRKVEEGLEGAGKKQKNKNNNPMHLRFFMRWFVSYLEPPVSVKTKAPETFQPDQNATLNKKEVLKRFSELQDSYLALLEHAATVKLDLSSIKVSNPVVSFIKMSAAECIAVAAAHQKRHIWQAEQVLIKLKGTET